MAENRIYFQTQPLLSMDSRSTGSKEAPAVQGKGSFAELLAAEQKKVSFSQHAMSRLQERNLSFSSQDLTRLDDTIEKMAQKGARESLVYLNDVALVVSVANKKVITAMDSMSARENIFTNIDSAAIL